MTDTHRGAKVGTRVALLVSHAIVATHKALLGTKHKLAMMVFRAISDEISKEVDTTLGPILSDLAARHPEDGAAHELLSFMATEHGQLKALVGQGLAQSGLLWPLSQILNNALAPAVYDALRHSAQSLPDASTVAQIAAQGLEPFGNAVNDIAAWGYNAGWAGSMIAASQTWPDSSLIQTMRNRGLIDDSEAKTYLKRAGLPDQAIDIVLATRVEPLAPAEAALAVLRGNMTQADGTRAAELWGVQPDDFDILVKNTGEPIDLTQLQEAYRRHIIDETRLVHGILQSRVRNEWIDVVKALRYGPMSVADAVNAHVQNHIDEATMRSIADENGLVPGQVDTLYLTAGEPLSRGESSELVNRGLMTEAEFVQDLRESRLKDKYISKAFELRRRLLEPRMLSSAVEVGAVAHDYAIQIAMMYGYNQKDAQILVSEGSARKLRTYRDRVVAGIESLYEANAITAEQASELIKPLGYEGSEAQFILEAANFRRNERLLASGISAVRSKYVGRHITIQKASSYLDAMGIPSGQRDTLLGVWAIEHAANVKQLTEAQVTKALKLQLITAQQATDRLIAMGYDAADAALLIGGA